MKKLIAIDPGHGLNTAGKRTPMFPDGTSMKEREFNSAVCGYVQEMLEDSGFDVLNVAESDNDVPLTTRTALANNTKQNKFNRPADLYISIHANASGDGLKFNDASGIETFIYSRAAAGSTTENWAKIIHNKLIVSTGGKDRGLKRRSDLYVIQSTSMPACLLECGFMTNREEALLLKSYAYRRTAAKAIADGVCDIFGVTALSPPVTQPPIGADSVPAWQKNALDTLVSYGIVTDPAYWDKRLGEEIKVGEVLALIANTLK